VVILTNLQNGAPGTRNRLTRRRTNPLQRDDGLETASDCSEPDSRGAILFVSAMTNRPAALGIDGGDGSGPEILTDAALTSFVAEHYGRLLGLARLICRDAPDAADAVQLGLEQAWRHRAALKEADRLRAWLDRIIAREAVRLSVRRRSWLVRLSRTDVVWLDPPDSAGDLTPDITALRDAFDRLPPDQRAVIALHFHLGYSIAETAELVGAPVETVRTRVRRAKDRLRHDLEEADR
jgi:RNA polymerase sigma-70 factor (ECF subfamily)